MKLQDQVTNLELSKKLKELGVKQESYFYHVNSMGEWDIKHVWDGLDYSESFPEKVFAAFTAAELFEEIYRVKIDLWIYHNAGKYLLQSHTHGIEFNEERLIDCLGELLVKLKKEELT